MPDSIDCQVAVRFLAGGTRYLVEVTVRDQQHGVVSLLVRWPDAERLVPLGLEGGRAAVPLPTDNGPFEVEVYASPRLHPEELGCAAQAPEPRDIQAG